MMNKALLYVAFFMTLSGCYLPEDLANVGKPPKFTPIQDPFKARPRSYEHEDKDKENCQSRQRQSLWAKGKKSFFTDQRAHRVGDILTVRINVTGEKAVLESTSKRDRTSKSTLNIPQLLGQHAEGIIGANPAYKFERTPDEFTGHGKVDRKEDIIVTISAVVTEVLPNGNLVIEGRQEMRLNFEIREIYITGIVRTQDISEQNEVEWKHIAEARMGYGGRGQITQFQQPPYGQQVLDILSPF